MNKLDVERNPTANMCPNEDDCSLKEEVAILRRKCLELEELSFFDALTGLYNLRYLHRALEMEMERTRRTKLPTGLIMIDLDHFRNVNTLYGHECGNAVLANFGRILKEGVRLIDVPCRYGGEEFALVLPGSSLRQATRIAERIQESTRASRTICGGNTLRITASFGIAVFNFGDVSTVGEFLNRADRFLYEAKTSGRDRICAEETCVFVAPEEVTDKEKAALFSSSGEKE